MWCRGKFSRRSEVAKWKWDDGPSLSRNWHSTGGEGQGIAHWPRAGNSAVSTKLVASRGGTVDFAWDIRCVKSRRGRGRRSAGGRAAAVMTVDRTVCTVTHPPSSTRSCSGTKLNQVRGKDDEMHPMSQATGSQTEK